jgi:S1-C subfamily serine protease
MTNSPIPWPLRAAFIVLFMFGVLVGLTAAPAASFGLTVNSLTSAILRDLGLPGDTRGVVVSAVRPNSVAALAGVQTGDIIQKVNNRRVGNMTEYEKAMQRVDTMVMFVINRKGVHIVTALEGPAEPAR